MKSIIKLLLTFAIIFASTSIWAQGDLITAKEFKALIKSNSELIIIDASKAPVYKKSHVKNAIHIDHNDMYKDADIPGLILPIDELAAFFGKKGISDVSDIIVYDGGSQKYSSRVYWALLYAGALNVKIVHKDMKTWRNARIPLTSQVARHQATTFSPAMDPSVIVDINYIKDNIDNPNVVIIDNRNIDEFVGSGEDANESKGHIPGAIHCNYVDLLEDNGAFKSAEVLQARAVKLGITPDKEVIFYCKTSIRGAVGWVMARNVLGYQNVRLFDGAYVEWETTNKLEK